MELIQIFTGLNEFCAESGRHFLLVSKSNRAASLFFKKAINTPLIVSHS